MFPRTRQHSSCLRTAAGAADTVRVINSSRAHSTVPVSERYFLTYSRLKKKRSTSTLVSTDSTLACWPSALYTLPSGPGNKTKYVICALDISAQAQAAPRHWSQQRNFQRTSVQSFPVVDVP